MLLVRAASPYVLQVYIVQVHVLLVHILQVHDPIVRVLFVKQLKLLWTRSQDL